MSLTLKNVTLENFKCFKKEQTIHLGKLTILTGKNSSGKSSIIAAILGAIQSGSFPFKFSTNGKYTNMGDFKEVSHNHDTNNIIKIGMELRGASGTDYSITTGWENSKNNHLPDLNFITAKTEYFNFAIRKEEGLLLNFSYSSKYDKDYKNRDVFLGAMLQSFNTSFILQKSRIDPKMSKAALKREEAKARDSFQKFVESYYKDVRFKNYKITNLQDLREILAKRNNFRLIRTVETISNILNDYENNVNLISSFRLHPERTYLEKSKENLKIDKFGDGYLDQIVEWEHKMPSKFEELTTVLKKLGLLYSLRYNRIGGGRFEYLIRTKENGPETSISDVGFGINQFLPVIVADLQLQDESTLFVAEPEIHLHPAIQANFADYLVGSINDRKKNYVIETHSEYFINRIRLAIVKGALMESDLSVYYLEDDKDDVTVHKLLFGKRGQIEGAPKSFFDTYLMDIRDIALNVE